LRKWPERGACIASTNTLSSPTRVTNNAAGAGRRQNQNSVRGNCATASACAPNESIQCGTALSSRLLRI